jgi:hypothetical protein
MSGEPTKHNNTNTALWAAGFAVGIAIGIAIGIATHNIGAGVAIGVGIGVALGVAFQSRSGGNPDPMDDDGRGDQSSAR